MFDLMTRLVEAIGAPGVGLLMLLENLFPPIPSEIIMPMAGYNASTGRMSFAAVLFWGSLGSLAGALFWYWVGAAIGPERLRRLSARYGRWLTLSPEDIDRTEAWFRRHGGLAVLFGRLVPTVRTLISVPAGVAAMPIVPFTLYSAIGTVIWTGFLAGSGWVLGEAFEEIDTWINPVSTAVIVGIIGIYLYRVITWKTPAP